MTSRAFRYAEAVRLALMLALVPPFAVAYALSGTERTWAEAFPTGAMRR